MKDRGPASAMIAIFALRGALADDDGTLPMRVRVYEGAPPVSLDEAAAFLHALPKPLGLAGSVRGDVLTLDTRDEHLNEIARVLLARTAGKQDANEDYEFVRARYGDDIDDLEVVCFSAGAYLWVRMADLKEFERSYFLAEAGNRGTDFADTAYPAGQGADPVRLAGAHVFVSFGA